MSGSIQRAKVLIVEDEPDLRKMYRMALECLDVDLFEAPDGAAAAGLLERIDLHVIVTDLAMPRMDGFELCRRARNHGRSDPPEVIAVSGEASATDAARIRECGARALLAKPFPMARLISEVEAAMASGREA